MAKKKEKWANPTLSGNPKKEIVRKANELVEARYRFDIWETRLFLKFLSLLGREEEEFKEYYKFYLTDFVKDFKLENAHATYKSIEQAGHEMVKKVITLESKDEGRKARVYTGLFTEFIITDEDDSQNYAKISVSKWLRPYLVALKDRYLSYDLSNIASLSSPYYVRIYELLKQYEKIGHRRFTVEDLKFKMELENKYKSYGHFKQDIIEPAKRNIEAYCDIVFEYEEIKKGRKVVELLFHISSKKEKKQPITVSKEESSSNIVTPQYFVPPVEFPDWLTAIGDKLNKDWLVNTDQLKLKALGKTEKDVQNAIAFTQERIKLGKVENPAGLFLDALEKGYISKAQKKSEEQEQKKREKTERLRLLKELEQLKLEKLAERARAINEQIRVLVKNDESIREAAFEAIKTSSNGYYKKLLLKFNNAPTPTDFREDELLRGAVIDEIQKQNIESFKPIYQLFDTQIKSLEIQIQALKI
ncbi:MAG: replication initiation protein [Saprospiraceae bacterium]|nr:replication initiation protein [Saprospiraceae bacterium]